MTREEAIKEAYGIPVNKKQYEALQFLIPELKKSEDERIIQFFAELATDACGGPGQEYYEEFGLNYNKVMTWLKSLPLDLKKKNEDVAKLCSNEWNKEDEEKLVRLLDAISIGNDYNEMRNWLLQKLKSVRPQPQKLEDWTEEDERKY